MTKHVSLLLGGMALVGILAVAAVTAQAQPPQPPVPPPPPQFPGFEGFGDIEDLLKNLPAGVDKDALKKALEMRKQLLQDHGFGGAGFGRFGLGRSEEGRLGIQATKPSETLADQLALPKGQGLVVEDVVDDSPAAKAGVKAHDILLEINGKPVSDSVRELKKSLEDIKPETAVDVVVLRKGKKETLKGLKLPEVKAAAKPNFGFGGFGQGPGFQFQFQGPGGGFGVGGPGTMTSVVRDGDNFQVRQSENGLTLSASGTMDQGKAKVKEIQVTEPGKTPQSFDSVDKVPDTYKEKVKTLLEIAEKGKVETKKP